MNHKLDINALVDAQQGRVTPLIYTDPDIYQLELERVFGRCWLFLAHESQIPKAGDFSTPIWAKTPLWWCGKKMVRSRLFSISAATAQCG